MSADGVSIQTSIAQAGVATRAQAKAQNRAKQKPPVSSLLEKGGDTKVEKIKESDESARGPVDSGGGEQRGGRRDAEPENKEENKDNAADNVGLVVDTRA